MADAEDRWHKEAARSSAERLREQGITHRRVEVKNMPRTQHIDQDMFLAFHHAYRKFIEKYGRVPVWEHVTFSGSTTSETITFKIAEEIQ